MEGEAGGAVEDGVGVGEGENAGGAWVEGGDEYAPGGGGVSEGAVEVGGEDGLDGGKFGGVAGVGEGWEDGDVLGQVDVGSALVVGLVGVAVHYQDGEEGVLRYALSERGVKGRRVGDGEAIVELVDGADDDGVVEAEVFAADGSALVGAWGFSLVGVF